MSRSLKSLTIQIKVMAETYKLMMLMIFSECASHLKVELFDF